MCQRRAANINHSSIDFPINFNSLLSADVYVVRADGVKDYFVNKNACEPNFKVDRRRASELKFPWKSRRNILQSTEVFLESFQ